MRGRSALLLALALTAFAAPAEARQTPPVTVLDLFQDMPVAGGMAFIGGCGADASTNGQFVLDEGNASFQFVEGRTPDPSGVAPSEGGRYFASCGTARFDADIPAGTHHVHVRFTGDRFINEHVSELSHNFTQTLAVSFDGGEPALLDYFSPADASRPPAAFDPPSYLVPDGAQRVTVEWRFKDHGSMNALRLVTGGANGVLGTDVSNPYSAHTVNATVRAPVIEFSGAPLPGAVSLASRVVGEREERQTRVQVVAEASTLARFAVNLRVEADPDLALAYVLTPDGRRLDEFTSNPLAGTPGFQPYNPRGLMPVVEPRADFYRATLPGEAVASHGAGTYTFVFAQTVPLDANPALLVLALLIMLVPFAIGAWTLRDVQSFRREAFGLYRKAATGLVAGVALVLAYYLAFVVQSMLQSEHVLMAYWPATGRGLVLLAHVLLATAALLAFGVSGRRLHNITRPSERPSA